MSVRVGITMPQFTDERARFAEVADVAEEVGLDSLWVFDHLWPLSGGKERPILECWSALAWLAGRTSEVTVGTMVTRSTLRHAALLAKMAATIGEIAPGRTVVTVGSGDDLSREENLSFGLPYFSGEDRTDQLRSIVDVLVTALDGGTIDRQDDFVSLEGLSVSPSVAQRPQVWVGGRSSEVLAMAADLADGWNGWGGTPERFASQGREIRQASDGQPTLSWAGVVVLEDSDDAAADAWGKDPGERIIGGPATVATALSRFVAAGAEHLILTHGKGWTPARLRLLVEEVIPTL